MKMCRKTKACPLMIVNAVLLHFVRTSCCRTTAGFKFVWNTVGRASAPWVGSGKGDVDVASGTSRAWGSWFGQACMEMKVQHRSVSHFLIIAIEPGQIWQDGRDIWQSTCSCRTM